MDTFNGEEIVWDDDPLETALKLEGITGKRADIARSIYQQESGSGRNTKTSNAGAVGGMQIIPATFNRMADQGWDINDPVHNARAGVRYIARLANMTGDDPQLTAAGYYGGEGAIAKAKQGISVSDPRNPNAPNTLQYGQQVASRLPNDNTYNGEEIIWDSDPKKTIDTNPTPLPVSPPSKNFGERLQADIEAIPRQTGLAARYAIEGLSSVPDILTQPVINLANRYLPKDYQQMGFGEMGKAFADKLNLPIPENSTERIIGDASRMLVGTGGIVGAAGLAKGALSGAGKAIASGLAYRPELQAASAVGSGLAGGYTRETGGNEAAQVAASVVGGVAAPMAANAGIKAINAARGTVNNIGQVRQLIMSALNDNKINPQNLPSGLLQNLESEVAKALDIGDVSGDALKRLIDYRLIGATPGRGNLTLKPADITQQKNLAKIGVNSSDPRLQALANQQNENIGIYIDKLNGLGADEALDAYSAGNKLIGAVKKPIANYKANISDAYSQAKGTDGLDVLIDANAFKARSDQLLKDNLLNKLLPKDIRNRINEFSRADNPIPLTVSEAEQFKTIIGDIQRNSNKGNVRQAISYVRQALDEAPPVSGQGEQSIDAFNKARGLNREFMGKVEKTPALQAVLDDAAPDDFIKKNVIRADVRDLARLKNEIKNNPEAIANIKSQLIQYIKEGAVVKNPDEARVFTQSGLNKKLAEIGEQKLRMFLSPEELTQLKALGRVSLYEQVQPVGSAVNNSNTAGSVISAMDGLSKYFPFGKQIISEPLEYMVNRSGGKFVSNVPNALTMQKRQNLLLPAPMLLIPGQIGNY